MIVVDAGIIVDLVIHAPRAAAVAKHLVAAGEAFAPELHNVEVAAALWRLNRAGELTDSEATQALSDALEVPVECVPHVVLGRRAWDLRHHVRITDAYYVALAQQLDAPLLTGDGRLARSHHGITVITVG